MDSQYAEEFATAEHALSMAVEIDLPVESPSARI
jgi:hypothetical protein